MHFNGSPDPPSGQRGPLAGVERRAVARPNPRFMSVGAVARALGMSEATMYRAVRGGEFPAVKIRGRYVIPVKVLDALEDAALSSGGMVDAADWVDTQGVA